MKKKLLSLVLAGAMVASTSVSAFASENKEVTIQKGQEKEVEVQVTGDITNGSNEVLPSTVTVTVPTSANFRVDKDGVLTSSEMKIVSNGDSPVSVIASEFIDTNGLQGIEVIKSGNISERNKIKLRLVGGDQDVVLSSEKNGENFGKMYRSDETTPITPGENFVIGNVTKEKALTLRLEGEGKPLESESGSATSAISDKFKLRLKIKKEK